MSPVGPQPSILGYTDEDKAVEVANGVVYGCHVLEEFLETKAMHL